MKRRYRFSLILIVLVVLLLPSVALAQSGSSYDFLTSDGDWENLTDDLWAPGTLAWHSTSVWADDVGWQSDAAVGPSDGNLISIYYEFDQPLNLSVVELDYHMVGANTAGYTEVWGRLAGEDEWRFLDHDPFVAAGDTHVEFSQATTAEDDNWTGIDQIVVSVYAYLDSAADPVFEITGISVEASPGYIQPVIPDDIIDEVTFPIGFGTDNTTSSLTVPADSNVYASMTGTVENISYESNGWSLVIRETIGGERYVVYQRLGAVYASDGDVVSMGCIIGLASQYHGSEAGEETSVLTFNNFTGGGDWHDWGSPSLGAAPCNQDMTANCLNANPDMNSAAEQWSANGFAFTLSTPFDQYVDLLSNGSVEQNIALTPASTYYVTLIVQNQRAAVSQLRVDLGDTTSTIDVNGSPATDFIQVTTQALSPVTPDFDPDLFTLTVTNITAASGGIAPNTIRATFICLHEGDVVIAPPACYFGSLPNNLASDWEPSGGATYEPPGTLTVGATYLIPNGDSIERPIDISAFSDADTDYEVSVGYFILVDGATPDSKVTVDVIDPDDDSVLEAVGVIESDSLLDILVASDHILTFTLGEGEHLVGNLRITNDSGDLTTDVTAIQISRICMRPIGTNGLWPGYASPDTTLFGLLTEDCTACVFPSDILNVPGWLLWLGCLVNYLIRCILLVPINLILGFVNGVVTGLGLLGRWLALVVWTFANYAGSLATRLLINLIAVGIGLLNTVLAWLYTQPFFQSILDAAAIVGLWLAAVWSYIILIRDFIAIVFNYGIAILSIISNTYSAFYAALNSPASYHLIPDCSDTGAPLYHLCLVFDILVFFFEQVPMALVFMGLLAALIMLAQLGRVLDLIGTMADSL